MRSSIGSKAPIIPIQQGEASSKDYSSIDSLRDDDLNDALEDRIWNGISTRIGIEKRKKDIVRWIQAAAVFSLVILAGGLYWEHIRMKEMPVDMVAFLNGQDNRASSSYNSETIVWGNQKKQYVCNWNEDFNVRTERGMTVIKQHDTVKITGTDAPGELMYMHVPSRKVLHVVMNDGTTCILNANSSLAFNADFRSRRRMALSGSGKFSVKHDAARPMDIIAGRDTIKDLGTVFYIRHYRDDNRMDVAVKEGEVAVRRVPLHAGEQLAIYKGNIIRKTVSETSRMDDQYINATAFAFSEERMDIVLEQIAYWYGVRLDIPHDRSYKTFTGQLPNNLSVDAVVDILNDLSDYNIQIVKKGIQETITIH
ncbi:MAG: FecR domain-containing protein [Chitinophagaceae bacterium]